MPQSKKNKIRTIYIDFEIQYIVLQSNYVTKF